MGSKPIGISGSRAATILGLNDWQSEFELWQWIMEEQYPGFNSLQGYKMPDDQDNASIRWGTAFEDAIIKLAEEQADKKIAAQEMLFHFSPKFYDIITCHIDGKYIDPKTEHFIQWASSSNTIHEGKTTSYWQYHDTWGEPGTDKVPAYVQCQVQHQLLCTGAENCIVSVLVFPKRPDEWEKEGWKIVQLVNKNYEIQKPNYESINNIYIDPFIWATVLAQMGYFHQYPITADKELHREMLEKYKEWWQFHIIEKQEPTPDRIDDIKRLFPEPVGTIVAGGN